MYKTEQFRLRRLRSYFSDSCHSRKRQELYCHSVLRQWYYRIRYTQKYIWCRRAKRLKAYLLNKYTVLTFQHCLLLLKSPSMLPLHYMSIRERYHTHPNRIVLTLTCRYRHCSYILLQSHVHLLTLQGNCRSEYMC